ncbi:unnamed protein product [Choristocarpus tenellus]
MADMNSIRALQQAERLVSTIVRAFYADTAVLVIDTLIREKYIKDKDEELGTRLNLLPKQVRSALAELQEEGLVGQEEMTDEIYFGRSSQYWYIDYRHAVDVIRLRVYEMQLILREKQQAKMARQTYVCPRCDAKFGVMEIQTLMNGAKSFCCSHCCENDSHSACVKTDHTLVDFHDKEGLDSVTSLLNQLNEQLNASTDSSMQRESIFQLVNALRDTVVPSNLPSELRARGMGGQQSRHLSSAHARFQDNFHHRGRAADKAAAERTAAERRGGSSRSVQRLYTKNWKGQEVIVEIEQSDEDDENEEGDEDGEEGEEGLSGIVPTRSSIKRKVASKAARDAQAAKRAKKALPSFLQGSKISGVASGGDDDDDDVEEEEEDEDEVSGLDSKSGAHEGLTRRLGAAVLTSVEELNEFKRRLRPWTEKMKRVWRKQQALGAMGENTDGEGGKPWWEMQDDENGGGVGSNLGAPESAPVVPHTFGRVFYVNGRRVPTDALTKEEAATLSVDDYTQFYQLASADNT